MNDSENGKTNRKNFDHRGVINDHLLSDLAAACRGLVFVSETDAEFEPFAADEVSSSSLRSFLSALGIGDTKDKNIEEVPFERFFGRLTEKKEWHRSIDKNRIRQFSRLRKVLESKLRDLRVIRVGKVRVDIYIAGLAADGHLVGVRTKAIET